MTIVRLPEKRKYRNQPTEVDGHKFASKREADRYQQLKLMQNCGDIGEIVLQPRFELAVNEVRICEYIADFNYWDKLQGREIVEDVKGVLTPVYRLKKKLMKAIYGIEIREV